jgi:hypothetical protein
VGGMEVDLPHLYQTVQNLGGLKEVIEKKKWQKVADVMKIPRSAQDRITKLDDIYCKYLLPYDTLSQSMNIFFLQSHLYCAIRIIFSIFAKHNVDALLMKNICTMSLRCYYDFSWIRNYFGK